MMKNLAKWNGKFRDASRLEDSLNLRAAFKGLTQSEIANRASKAIGVSPRQIIYWMKCENDMPSWAVKAVLFYLKKIETSSNTVEARNELVKINNKDHNIYNYKHNSRYFLSNSPSLQHLAKWTVR